MFNPLAAQEIAAIVSGGLLPAGPTVIDLGNQTFGVDDAALRGIVAGLEPVAAGRGVDLAALRALGGQRRGLKARHASEAPLTEAFYRAMGFRAYEAIDINSRFGSHVMDLNHDLDRHYGFSRRFDLVANIGTSEHVFNQAAVLRNAHNLASDAGLMLHIVPFTGYMNHGFYNYQPTIFRDLAAANGYDLVRLHVADRDRMLCDLREPSDLAAHFGPWLSLAGSSDKGNTFLVALLRRRGSGEFVFPCQGRYLDALEGAPREAYLAHQGAGGRTAPADAGATPRGEPLPVRLRRRFKRSLLKSLRRASRTVLMRM